MFAKEVNFGHRITCAQYMVGSNAIAAHSKTQALSGRQYHSSQSFHPVQV